MCFGDEMFSGDMSFLYANESREPSNQGSWWSNYTSLVTVNPHGFMGWSEVCD